MEKLSMGSLRDKLKKLTKAKLRKETETIILADREIVKRKKAELKGGVRPSGAIIGTYASESYRLFKLQKNPLARGNVDLILTGRTKDKLYLVSLKDGRFTFESGDEKWAALVEKYGIEIKGINQEVFRGFQQQRYAPELIEVMRQYTGL